MSASGFDLTTLGVEVGSGTALGFIAGYATKKLIKIAVVVIGLFLAALKFLEAKGIIETVHWGKLVGLTPNVSANATAPGNGTVPGGPTGAIFDIVSVLPFGGGFAVGFALGMKKG